ncbi:transposase [Sphingomonas sp. BK481]|jgi:transposase|nr:transposase [Sphingomonas sp. BK481]
MSDLYWLTDEQMARLQPSFPKSHGKPRSMIGGCSAASLFVNRNGLRWCDAPKDYGRHCGLLLVPKRMVF